MNSECGSDVEHLFGDLEATRVGHMSKSSDQAAKHAVVDLTLEDGEEDVDTADFLVGWMTHDDMQLLDLRWHRTSIMIKKAGAVFWPVRILRADELLTNGVCLTGGKYCKFLGDTRRKITSFTSLHQLPQFLGPTDPDTLEKYEQTKSKLQQYKKGWEKWKYGFDLLVRAHGLLAQQHNSLERVLQESARQARIISEPEKPAKRRKVVKYVPYKKEIRLHVGDIIQYNNRLFTMGTRQGREFSQIIEINPSLPSPLVLDSGYKLKRSDVIMRVKRADGKPEKSGQEGCQKPLKYFFFSRETRLKGAQTMQEELIEMVKRDRNEINEQAMAMATEHRERVP